MQYLGLIEIHEMHQNPKKTWEVTGHLRIAFAQLLAGHKDIIINTMHNINTFLPKIYNMTVLSLTKFKFLKKNSH